jgi:hypothetical protein
VTPYSLGDEYWHFNGKYCLILKMDGLSKVMVACSLVAYGMHRHIQEVMQNGETGAPKQNEYGYKDEGNEDNKQKKERKGMEGLESKKRISFSFRNRSSGVNVAANVITLC